MNHIYKVPIIPQDAEKQQTIIQVAENLYHLSAVTDDIFKNISNRIAANQQRLAAVQDRVDTVNRKIKKLNGVKKATQVFSTSKYPAVDHNKPYITIFKDAVPPKLISHKVKSKNTPSTEENNEKLQIYHVKTNANKSTITGLGDIPHDIECVNDLLLFNSGKNLYRNFAISEEAEVPRQIQQEQIDSTLIGAAPHSISERPSGPKSTNQTFAYAPYMGTVPVLDVPLDLPDLPNIADDLRYDTELGPGIAPSATLTDQLPELPVVVETIQEIISPEPVEEQRAPSPPVLSPKLPEVQELPLPEVPVTKEQVQPEVIQELPQLDMRASLMEAIRNAGGTKKLKATTSNKPVNSGPSAGSLFADLHAKLSMRRKGISGTKPEGMDAGSALEKISAMIPPPTNVSKNAAAAADDDEDWDD